MRGAARGALLVATLLALAGCADAFRDHLSSPLSGTPLTVRLSADGCAAPPAPAAERRGAPAVRQVTDMRREKPLVGSMKGAPLVRSYQGRLVYIPLHQAGDALPDQALRRGVEQVLARTTAGVSPYALDLVLGTAWVESRPTWTLQVPISATVMFAAALVDPDKPASVAEGRFRGNAQKDVWYAVLRDHEAVLNEAYCKALTEFERWLAPALAGERA